MPGSRLITDHCSLLTDPSPLPTSAQHDLAVRQSRVDAYAAAAAAETPIRYVPIEEDPVVTESPRACRVPKCPRKMALRPDGKPKHRGLCSRCYADPDRRAKYALPDGRRPKGAGAAPLVPVEKPVAPAEPAAPAAPDVLTPGQPDSLRPMGDEATVIVPATSLDVHTAAALFYRGARLVR